MALNSVNIMGNLTRDPEIKYLQNGRGVCNLSIANNRVYTKDGEKVTEVSYFNVDVWGPQAESCSKYLAKGAGVVIEGRLKQDRWERDGKTQSTVRIVANSVHFLPRRDAGAQYQGGGSQQPAAAGQLNDSDVAWDE